MGKCIRVILAGSFVSLQLFSVLSFGKGVSPEEKIGLLSHLAQEKVLTTEKSDNLGTFSERGSVLTLEERMSSELTKKTADFPSELNATLTQKHVVVVDGIMNELAHMVGNYFSDNISQLQKLGIESTHLRYSSRIAIPKNADVLYSDILNIYEKQKKPIILVGHSMGGAESLYAILKHPDLLFSNIVEKVVLIEPAIGGSDLVDHLVDNVFGREWKSYLGEGLESLRPEVSQRNFREIFALFQKTLKEKFEGSSEEEIQRKFDELSKRVFYVRSIHTPNSKNLSIGLDIVLLFFKGKTMEGFDNDGLMPIHNQILGLLPAFGIDLGVLQADHIELVISGFSSHSNRANRKAFTRALLQTIYENPDELMKLAPERPMWTSQ